MDEQKWLATKGHQGIYRNDGSVLWLDCVMVTWVYKELSFSTLVCTTVVFIPCLIFSLANNLKQCPSTTLSKITRNVNFKGKIRQNFHVLLSSRRYICNLLNIHTPSLGNNLPEFYSDYLWVMWFFSIFIFFKDFLICQIFYDECLITLAIRRCHFKLKGHRLGDADFNS